MHAAWGLALSAKIRDELGLESDAIWSDDGIIVHLPDADEPPGADLVLIDPDELEDRVVAELGGSALFGARFRENAARALLIPRAYPGKRTPLWQQRLKSQSLLEVARRYADFPVVLETYRECLRDVLDLPGLQQLLTQLHRRELSLVEVETQTASPFASSLLFDYVATYMYEGDTPNAERRAAALALDRDLLRELLGQEELRDLIDPGALEQVEDDLQHRSERTPRAHARRAPRRAAPRRRPHRRPRSQARVLAGLDAAAMLADLQARAARRSCCAWRARSAGSPPRTRASIATRWAPSRPAGCPTAFIEDVPDALARLVRRYARTHGPFTTARAARALRRRPRRRRCASSSAPASWCAASCARAAREREWCDTEVLRRLRRASLAVLRKEIEPADQRAFARFLPAWQGVDRHPPGGAGPDRLREVLVPLQGLALPAEVWERDVLPRRVGAWSPTWMDQLCAAGELVWVGAGALGRRSGRVALYFREDARAARAAAVQRGEPPGRRPSTTPSARAWRAGACFFTDLLGDVRARARGAPGGAVGPRLGRRGHQRRLGAAARAAPDARRARAPSASRARSRRFSLAPRRGARARSRAAGR